MTSKRTEKIQRYLRQEIIEENLNPKLFIAYLKSEKEDGNILSNWKIKDLKSKITEFRSLDHDELELSTKVKEKKLLEFFGNSDSESESESDSSSSSEEQENAMEESEPKMVEVKKEEEEEDEKDDEEKEEKEKKKKYRARKNVSKYGPTVLVGQEDELKVEVSNPEVVKAGLFKGSYTVYTIYTEPFQWLVKRRYSDFVWLYNCLVKRFPANYVNFF